jgi:hypothetical protein
VIVWTVKVGLRGNLEKGSILQERARMVAMMALKALCVRLFLWPALSVIFLHSNAQKPRENAISWAIMAAPKGR